MAEANRREPPDRRGQDRGEVAVTPTARKADPKAQENPQGRAGPGPQWNKINGGRNKSGKKSGTRAYSTAKKVREY